MPPGPSYSTLSTTLPDTDDRMENNWVSLKTKFSGLTSLKIRAGQRISVLMRLFEPLTMVLLVVLEGRGCDGTDILGLYKVSAVKHKRRQNLWCHSWHLSYKGSTKSTSLRRSYSDFATVYFSSSLSFRASSSSSYYSSAECGLSLIDK